MGISLALKHKLRAGMFYSHGGPCYNTSYNQNDAISSGFYQGKPTPFIVNKDLTGLYGGMGVTYSILPASVLQLTPEEEGELSTYFGTNYKGELRIITHNQRKTHRGNKASYHPSGDKGKYPRGQNPTNHILTPYDLNDVGTMLGYRGIDLFNYNTSGPTGIVSQDPHGEYYLNTALAGQAGHHPKSAQHTHPINSSNYSGGGYASILNKGCTRVGGPNAENLDNYITTTPTAPGYTGGGGGAMSVNGKLDLQYQTVTGTYLNGSFGSTMSAFKVPYKGGGSAPYYVGLQNVKTFQYKKTLTSNDLVDGCAGVINYPIILKAIHTLWRRNSTTYNNGIPDCFDYTVAVVCYRGYSHHGKVFDIICDRLRTIDRGDLQRCDELYGTSLFPHRADYGWNPSMLDFIHPCYEMINADSTGTSTSHGGIATFSNVPNTGYNKYFDGTGALAGQRGIEYYVKGDGYQSGAMNNTAVLTQIGSVLAHMPLGNCRNGSPTAIQFDYGGISAAYTPATSKLTIEYQPGSTANNPDSDDIPLLLLRP